MAIRPGAQGPRGGAHEVSAEATPSGPRQPPRATWRPHLPSGTPAVPRVPAHAREPAGRRQERVHGAARPAQTRATPPRCFPAPCAQLRPHHRVGTMEGGVVLHCSDRTTCCRTGRPTSRRQSWRARVFERSSTVPTEGRPAEGKGAIFARAARVPSPGAGALDTPAGPGLGLRAQTRVFDRLVYGSGGPALGGKNALRDLRGAALTSASATSFRGVGAPCWRVRATETFPGGRREPPRPTEDRHRRPSRCRRRGQDRRRRRDPAEARTVFPGYWRNRASHGGPLHR